MSKHTISLREETKYSKAVGDAIQTTFGSPEKRKFLTKIRSKDTIHDTVLEIERLEPLSTLDTPKWQVSLAATGGITAKTATETTLAGALAKVVRALMLDTGPVGALAIGIAYEGSILIADFGDKVKALTSEAIIALDATGIWQSFRDLAKFQG